MLSAEAEAYINHRGINEGRVVLHSDLNNFFASVECLKYKSLKAYPVAVCGSIEERHGIVLAKNNLAKARGVKTGQVIWQAKAVCPELIVLEPNYEEYLYYSKKTRSIYSFYSDRVEPFGMDEAWIELTCGKGINGLYDGVRTANKIRKQVYESTGLTVSVGVSDNKIFSKLASDYRKPDAVTLLGPDQFLRITSSFPVGDMIFVGKSSQKRLKLFHIEIIKDVAESSAPNMKAILGKNGINLYLSACGYDSSPVVSVNDSDVIKSLGNSATLSKDISGREEIKRAFYAMSEKVSSRLRKAGLKATVLQIHIRDTKLVVSERQCKIFPSNNAKIIAESAFRLFLQCFDENIILRSLGVRTSGFIKSDEEYQNSFFDIAPEATERDSRLDSVVDSLRRSYGERIIKRALLCYDNTSSSGKYMLQPFKTH